MDIHSETILISIVVFGLVVGLLILFIYSLIRFIRNRNIQQQSTLETLRNLEQKMDTLIEHNKSVP
ncbi:hypothetical protein PBAT_21330 [Paenibacillus antarcticus]|uniref:DUF4083 domain-containing protein n=1 Tax=Paenibacillus antarcticus TaxID=253703 RepID=A0A162LX49_9BACL|nr:hypothetical protein [Paenibacillus antarcticus]OAB41107.1 hypothetical protein PBAT_21330 [Paenibacillus antarcticus]